MGSVKIDRKTPISEKQAKKKKGGKTTWSLGFLVQAVTAGVLLQLFPGPAPWMCVMPAPQRLQAAVCNLLLFKLKVVFLDCKGSVCVQHKTCKSKFKGFSF